MDLVEVTADLPTPFLALDDRVVSSNIERMQRFCEDAGIDLRPHIKTHKSSVVARRQLDAGAVGVTVATLSEAIALGETGVHTDVFLSTPAFYDRPKSKLLERAVAVHRSVSVAVDSESVLRSLVASSGPEVGVMIELESGMDRTGTGVESGIALARAAGERMRGFFTHGGHGYGPDARESAGADEMAVLSEAGRMHHGSHVLSAGSTPTVEFSGRSPVTEERPGTYVYGDRQQVVLGAIEPSQVAAAIVTTVIHSSGDKIVLDAGAKVLTKDKAPFLDGHGHALGGSQISIDRLNDQHGMARVVSGDRPPVGRRLVVIPNHICPVVNLFDEVVLVGSEGVSALSVDLRGLPA